MMTDSTDNKKEFWKEIGKLGVAKERRAGIPMEVVMEDGSVSSDVNTVLTRWRDAFSTLLNVAPEASDRGAPLPGQDSEDHADLPFNDVINVEEILTAMQRAKNGKATGCDGIPVEVLRNGPTVRFLHSLFNEAFSTGTTPSIWRKCFLNPIPKNTTSDQREPSNYRGLALACSTYKLYCGVLNSRLAHWAEDNSILSDAQNGFRRGRNTVDHLCTLSSVIESRKLRRKPTFVAFVDFHKAYDSINRALLWTKLSDLGICGRIHGALRALYVDSMYAVRVNGHSSDWFNVSCGLRQGCLLSPILFNLYINDLAVEIDDSGLGTDLGDGTKLAILLYADDLALLAEDAEQLQALLDILGRWCARWQLRVNPSKSAVLHFRTPATPRWQGDFHCGDIILPGVTQYKYLGLLFTDHLDYKVMATCAAGAASRALGVIISKAKALGGMPFPTFTKLYDSLVWPILDYGAAVWGTREFSAVEAVHHRACRFFLGVRRFTPNAAVTGDMGWTSPGERQWTAVSRHWHRLCVMPPERLTKRVFTWCLDRATHGVRNWHHRLHQQWARLGLEQEGQPAVTATVSKGLFLRTIADKLHQARDSAWISEVTRVHARRGPGLNKLRTYRRFKDCFRTEAYVMAVMSRSHRSALACFRCGTAPLKIETGRYEGLPVEQRTCLFCDGSVEDEQHVLIACPLYNDIREDLFTSTELLCPEFRLLTDNQKFEFVLSNECLVMHTARACRKILNRRAIFTYQH